MHSMTLIFHHAKTEVFMIPRVKNVFNAVKILFFNSAYSRIQAIKGRRRGEKTELKFNHIQLLKITFNFP